MEENKDTRTPGSENSSKVPKEVQEFVKNSDSFKEKYDIAQELGGGNYGGVFSAWYKGKNKTFKEREVALKIMEESSFKDSEIESNLTFLKEGPCENLVQFIHLDNITYNNKKFYIVVMELCTGGTLDKSKFQDRYKEYEFQLHILRGLFKGLIFIHSFDLVHHDIHEGNILFKSESDPTVKYGDFGLTKEEASHTKWDDTKRLTVTLIRVVFKIKSSVSLKVGDIASKLRDKEVSKNIIEVIVGLRERSMDLEDALEKIEDMIRKQPKEGDDRITASAPEGSCFPSTSGLQGRRKSNQEDGACNHIQKRRKIDAAQVEFKVNDVEILFDYLSRRLVGPGTSLELCVALLHETTVVESCKTRYSPEISFKIMNTWKCRRPELDHAEELKNALKEIGRLDLAEDIGNFSIESFRHHHIEIEGPEIYVGEDDFVQISRHLAHTYVHVVRYLGLRQKDIDKLETNFPCDIKTKIIKALKIIKNNFPSLNRKHVCDALYYAEENDVIVVLNKGWGKA
ncbi:uncharacterized protein LOC134283237 [Saccostrea cucullata]|uniref:uncharacterized protein LOC134283237 n=1 Tax=Saccostrea cuccullata TaxID=36930 RepID=UPI002ED0FF58